MALIERFQKTTDITYWPGQIPMNYMYTVGRAGEKFFRELINGKIFGARCTSCQITYVPPRIYCEKCFARLEDNYQEVSSKGFVYTYTLSYENFDGSKKETPSLLAVIRLEGTEGGFVHWLGEISFGKVYIGMPVEAVFKPPREREGSILDIKYFRPI